MNNRTYKFRAWNKILKVMGSAMPLDVLLLDAAEYGNVEEQADRISQVEVMQFTGLLDKDGKEIYEGDILLYIKSKSKGKDKKRKEEHQYWSVSMSPKGQWVATRDDIAQSLASATERHEIIGNIYETPDLITKTT